MRPIHAGQYRIGSWSEARGGIENIDLEIIDMDRKVESLRWFDHEAAPISNSQA
jgi:hypothetical protein